MFIIYHVVIIFYTGMTEQKNKSRMRYDNKKKLI